mmetsp:Transcript_28823/g.74387  ORF Transcript_28823/g.74387 Transcript_28823/m.74387 type:complete len:425 (+) Transcript_28823:1228-2502(+)
MRPQLLLLLLLLPLTLFLHTSKWETDAQEEPPPLPSYCSKYSKAYLPSIWTDLLPWSRGITHDMIKASARRWTMENRYPGIAVAFRGGQVFLFKRANLARTFKHHAKEAIIYLEVFQDLARRHGAGIPDIDLVLATNDIPAVNIANVPVEDNMTYLPQFRYCRSFENPNILVPVWQLYEFHYSKRFLQYIDTNFTDPPWELRAPKLYGRLGRWDRFVDPTSRRTYRHGMRTPRKWFTRWTKDLQDPRIDVKDLPYVPITEWRRNKYIMFVDGITFSSKLEKLMALGSVTMVEQSGYRSFYQMQLRPFEHYVPFWFERPQEALDALAWMMANDNEARQIARNAQLFAKEMLNKQALRCYWMTLFREYAKLFKYRPADVQYDTWISATEYLADFRVNKPNYTREWHTFANKTGFEFEDPFGLPEDA